MLSRRGTCIVLTLVAMGFALATPCSADDSADQLTCSAVGPLESQALIEALARAFSESSGRDVRLKYQRIALPSAAAASLLEGADLIVTTKALGPRDLGQNQKRWEELAPEKRVIGTQTVALVAHMRNPLDSLSTAQLKSLWGKRARSWKDFGGDDQPIRRYGLGTGDPLTRMFHDRALMVTACGLILRRQTSTEVLAAITSDPYAIGYVNAADATTAGESVKVLAIEAPPGRNEAAGQRHVLPDAQSTRDGTYPLSQPLIIYAAISDANLGLADFLDFISSDTGQAIVRKHGYTPTIDVIRRGPSAAFQKLYGPDLERVKATNQTADDIQLAENLVQTAAKLELDPDLTASMCHVAFDLTAKLPDGQTVAFMAAATLGHKVPEKRCDAQLKRAMLFRAAYETQQIRADGERAVVAMMTAADLATESRDYIQAKRIWDEALAFADAIGSDHQRVLEDRRAAFTARTQSARRGPLLLDKLRESPDDAALRRDAVLFFLVELDDPVTAGRYLSEGSPEDLKLYVPMAAQPLEAIKSEAMLSLAEWYATMVINAGPGGTELLEWRAQRYYHHFLRSGDVDDELVLRAKFGLQRLGLALPNDVSHQDNPGRNRPQRPRADLSEGESITDAIFAGFIAENPNLSAVTAREIGSASQLRGLQPLEHMRQLQAIDLRDASSITDLKSLANVRTLKSVRLRGLDVTDASPLASLTLVETLDLSGAEGLKEIAFVVRMKRLRFVTLDGCTSLADISALADLKQLERLSLSGCTAIRNLEPLAKLQSLTHLDLRGINEIDDIKPLASLENLKSLNLKGVGLPNPDDAQWLGTKLPRCRIVQ